MIVTIVVKVLSDLAWRPSVASESALTVRTDLNLSIPAVTFIPKEAGFHMSLIVDR